MCNFEDFFPNVRKKCIFATKTTENMDIDIREIEIRDLRPNSGELEGLPRNPRKISKKMLEKLKKSLQDAPEMLRLRELIVVPHGEGYVVIAGNQRLEAAKAVGMTALPCKVLPADTDPAKLREYAIKDNLPFGEDDWEVIASDWDTAELEEWGMSVPDKWKDNPTEQDDDFDPDSVKATVCKKGDIWHLGDHRLMCGDSTSADDVSILMNGKRANIVLTDPPYGISIVDKDGKIGECNLVSGGIYMPVKGDETTDTARLNFDIIKELSDKQIIFGGNYFLDFLPPSPSWIIWDKKGDMESNNFADGEMAWCSFHTPVRIFSQIWRGMIKEGENGKRVHPTQKPVNLLGRILTTFSKDGDIVLDAFGGSGTTLIAAEQFGRKCYMMELDPHYCDVIIARWEKLTGKKATKIN